MAFKGTRWTLANILPVTFIWLLIGHICGSYVWFHLRRLLSSSDHDTYVRGVWQAALSGSFLVFVIICFFRAAATDPGSVPDDAAWSLQSSVPFGANMKGLAIESKADGGRRFCKWCDKYKPDRSHHCRMCRSCILKMDHHCPWICNCVGFRNYKFFFLLIFYAMKASLFICGTSWESIRWVAEEEVDVWTRFFTVSCMTFSMVISGLLVVFFIIHLTLLLRGTTTIEQCEMRAKKNPITIYSQGMYGNWKAALGPNPLLWFCPYDNVEGDGLSFPVSDSVPEQCAQAPHADRQLRLVEDSCSSIDTVENGRL